MKAVIGYLDLTIVFDNLNSMNTAKKKLKNSGFRVEETTTATEYIEKPCLHVIYNSINSGYKELNAQITELLCK